MTTKHTYIIFMIAILITVLLTRSHGMLPKRSLSIVPHTSGIHYLVSKPRRDGSPSGGWIDEAKRHYRCIFTDEDFKDNFYCSSGYSFEPDNSQAKDTNDTQNLVGINLSDYDKLIIDIDFKGPANYIRIFFRNFNTEYSRIDDSNSTKFLAALLNTSQLNKTIEVPMEDFRVADWWLAQYKVPQSLSGKELDNVVSLGIDFAELRPPTGEYEITLNEAVIEGNLLNEENWYLLIIYSWLAGIFLYASSRLFFMHLRNRESQKLISELSKKNTHLLHETDKFRKLSTVDALTNTYNRFGVDQVINSLSPSSQDSAKAHADIPY